MTEEEFDLFPDFENPFTFEHFLSRLDFYGPIKPIKVGPVTLDTFTIDDRLNDYFNKNWYEIKRPMPRLTIDDPDLPISNVWMSITPLEIQSHALAIYKAAYDVYTSGLGMGYFALSAAAKSEVDNVIVYELRPEVIEIFTNQFQHRPEFSKIEIREGDFLEALRNEEIDSDEVIFNDIYPSLNTEAAIDHFAEFLPLYPNYEFWGIERYYLDAMGYHEIRPSYVPPLVRKLFGYWMDTSVDEATGIDSDIKATLNDLYFPITDLEACEKFIEVLDEVF
jgi:hypothetical protein